MVFNMGQQARNIKPPVCVNKVNKATIKRYFNDLHIICIIMFYG